MGTSPNRVWDFHQEDETDPLCAVTHLSAPVEGGRSVGSDIKAATYSPAVVEAALAVTMNLRLW